MDDALVIHTAKFHYVALADEANMRPSSSSSVRYSLSFKNACYYASQ